MKSPTVVGYAPDSATVNVDVTDILADKTYIVTYKPAEVEYTVKHYQQNVDNDKYTLKDTETKKGYTESAVGDKLAKTYTGFTALLYDTTTKIAADEMCIRDRSKGRKIYNIITTIMVAIVVVTAALLVGAKVIGFQTYSVLSGSMEPTYHTGSLIYVKKTDPQDIRVGDPITFCLLYTS